MSEINPEELIKAAAEGVGVYQIEIVVTRNGALAVVGSRNDELYNSLPELHQQIIDLVVENFIKSAENEMQKQEGVERIRHVVKRQGPVKDILDAGIVEDGSA